jgi:hypothetical protein
MDEDIQPNNDPGLADHRIVDQKVTRADMTNPGGIDTPGDKDKMALAATGKKMAEYLVRCCREETRTAAWWDFRLVKRLHLATPFSSVTRLATNKRPTTLGYFPKLLAISRRGTTYAK